MKKICVVTGTRAEYSLLYHTIKAIEQSAEIHLQLIVTGSHLSVKHGLTVNAIKKDNVYIDYEIDMLMDSENKSSIPKSIGLLMIQLSQCFDALKPDIVLILGDRYELLAIASCAVTMNIPIAHLHGGEITEGAIDEQIRHAITKMAHLHFATTELHKNNILKMGEQAFRVFNVGAPVVENINNFIFLSREELEKELKIKIKRLLFIITYHPITIIDFDIEKQIDHLLLALGRFEGTFIFTGSNADFGGNIINRRLQQYAKEREDSFFFESLGSLYLNVCKHADVMVGNSSSGIIEAPCFKLPVVNIGNRQKGRLRHSNIIDVGYDSEQIGKGIDKALCDRAFRNQLKKMNNLYGDGTTSKKIIEILKKIELDEEFVLKKLIWE